MTPFPALDRILMQKSLIAAAIGLACSLSIACTIILSKYTTNLKKYVRIAKVNDIESALNDIRNISSRTKAQIPPDMKSRSPEEKIYASLDSLKSRYGKNASIKIDRIEEKDDEVSIGVNLSLSARELSALAAEMGYLQSLSFPFLTVNSLAIKSAGKNTVTAEIQGTMRTMKVPKPK